MHRCLEIQEVVRVILGNLQHDPSYYYPLPSPIPAVNWVSLARIARTCRAFSDLALDILWQDQYSLLPLLKCLPAHTWEMVNVDIDGFPRQKMRFISPIKTSDWDRVMAYARRVRSMRVLETTNLWLEAFELLNISLPVVTLFPNLRRLSWNTHQTALFPYIRLLLPPSLTSIDIEMVPTAAHLAVLSYLSSTVPSLTAVRINTSPAPGPAEGSQQMTEEATSFILALKDVRKITVPAVLPTAYQALASLSSLRHLNIANLNGCLPPEQSSSETPRFQALERLSVGATQIQLVKNALQWCDRTPLKHLNFTCSASPTGAALANLLVVLGDHCTPDSLTGIDMTFLSLDEIIQANPTPYELSPAVLRPLLVFHNLTYLVILSALNFALDDEFIDALSKALPKIETLRFRVGFGDSRRGSVTLSGLRAFALHCPHLDDLELTFDATTVPPGPHPAPGAPLVRQTCLSCLVVADSPIDAPGPVAHFLSAMFPELQTVEATRILTEEEDEELRRAGRSTFHNWGEVEKLVPLLAAARADEQIFWTAQNGELVAPTA
ncbi:hypothetical protein C8R46DRAFT_1094941 [Mycena filopes]|nr:hypothetical protein C8R46DRAFT_1094941 [Mycena filopes]